MPSNQDGYWSAFSSNLENVTRLYAHHDDYQWSFANCVEDLDAPPDPLSPVFPWHRTALLHHSDYWQYVHDDLRCSIYINIFKRSMVPSIS